MQSQGNLLLFFIKIKSAGTKSAEDTEILIPLRITSTSVEKSIIFLIFKSYSLRSFNANAICIRVKIKINMEYPR